MAKNNLAVLIDNPNPNWKEDGDSPRIYMSAWEFLCSSHKHRDFTFASAMYWGIGRGDVDYLYRKTLYRYVRRKGGEISRKECKEFNQKWRKRYGHIGYGKGSRSVIDSLCQFENRGACIEWNFYLDKPNDYVTWLHDNHTTSIKNPDSIARDECELNSSLINQLKKEIENEQRISSLFRRTAQQIAVGDGATSPEANGHGHGQRNGTPRQFNQRIGAYRIFHLENGANPWENDGHTWQSEIGQGRKLEFFPARDGTIVAISSPLV